MCCVRELIPLSFKTYENVDTNKDEPELLETTRSVRHERELYSCMARGSNQAAGQRQSVAAPVHKDKVRNCREGLQNSLPSVVSQQYE